MPPRTSSPNPPPGGRSTSPGSPGRDRGAARARLAGQRLSGVGRGARRPRSRVDGSVWRRSRTCPRIATGSRVFAVWGGVSSPASHPGRPVWSRDEPRAPTNLAGGRQRVRPVIWDPPEDTGGGPIDLSEFVSSAPRPRLPEAPVETTVTGDVTALTLSGLTTDGPTGSRFKPRTATDGAASRRAPRSLRSTSPTPDQRQRHGRDRRHREGGWDRAARRFPARRGLRLRDNRPRPEAR